MKIIEIIINKDQQGLIQSLVNAQHDHIVEHWQHHDDGQERVINKILVSEAKSEIVLDNLNLILKKESSARLIVCPIDATLPRVESKSKPNKATRESLVKEAGSNSHLSVVFVSMVILSTIVASIGMLENNIAVIIGAMVIAPLLGPNLSLAIGTAMGETKLMFSSFATLMVGLAIAVSLSVLIGLYWQAPLNQLEVLSRTEVHLSTVILALASGAAAVLSITTKISSSLVGVMVAVAILPPASVLGMMLGSQNTSLAEGAGLLLLINIASINLAANSVMILRKIKPKDKKQQQKAKITTVISTLFWLVALAALVAYSGVLAH